MQGGHFQTSPPYIRVRFICFSAGGAALLFLLLAWLFPHGALKKADLWLQDEMVGILPPLQPPNGMVLLALDEASLNLDMVEPEELEGSEVLQLMDSDFPWSRAVYAAMVEVVLEAGARMVILDVLFTSPGEGDKILAGVLAKYPGQVVLAKQLDLKEEMHGHLGVVISSPHPSILPTQEYVSAGFVNFWTDTDGVVRAADYQISLSAAKGEATRPGEPLFSSLAAVALQQVGEEEAIPKGVAPRHLRFHPPGAFPAYPLWSIFVPSLWEQNLQNGEVFRDQIVLFGPTASRFQDFHRTPLPDFMPGPVLHLNAISAALRGDFFHPVSGAVSSALVVLLSFCAAGLAFLLRQPFGLVLSFVVFLSGYFGVAVVLAHQLDILLPLVNPGGAFLLTGLLCFSYDFAAERKAKARVRRTLERYVSKDIVREILDQPASFLEELGGVRKEMTILFSDLRGFTALTEGSDPTHLVAQLNEYLRAMVEIVFRHEGTVDKFIGDAVMAVWGTVHSNGPAGDATSAVRAAQEMLVALEQLNQDWQSAGRPTLRVGIGVHSGEAVFGNIGSEQKMEPTVIGDAVNLASRLEGLCKMYRVPLVFSSQVREQLPEEMPVRTLDLVRVVGRKEPVEIFTLASDAKGRVYSPEWCKKMEEAIARYRKADFSGAEEILHELLKEEPEDAVCELYLGRCQEGKAQELGADWSPVFQLEKK